MNRELKLFKIFLYISSLLLLVGALAMVCSMVALMVRGKEYVNFMGNNSSWIIACAVVGVAVFMVFISALGCLGAAGQNTFLLKMYVVVVSILMVIIVAAGIVAFIYKDEAIAQVEENMKEKMASYRPDSIDYDTIVWDVIQEKFQCCGINSHLDWPTYHASYKTSLKRTPDSCKENSATSDRVYVDGCLLKVSETIRENHWSIGGAIAGVVLYLLLSICIVCMVIKNINDDDEPLIFKVSSGKGIDNDGMQIRA